MKKSIYSVFSAIALVLVFSLSTIHMAYADFSVFAIEAGPWQQAVIGQPFSLDQSVSGGTAPYTWSVASGALPAGLTLNTSTGLISGTPTGTGAYPITVQVQDSTGATTSASYPITVYAAVGGLAYSRTPSGSTVSETVTLHLKGIFGADFCNAQSTNFNVVVLGPSNIQSNNFFSSVGALIDQDFTFTLPVGDYQRVGVNCNGGPYSFTSLENGSPAFSVFAIAADPWQQAVNGQQFSLNQSISGGTAPYSWSVISGTLPSGLTLNTATGLISGTPTGAGSYPITVQVQDSTGGTTTANYPITVYSSIGGLSYSRSPSGSTVSSSVTVHVKGIFGADFCNAQSTNFNVVVLGSSNIQSNNVFSSAGTVIDQNFMLTLPVGDYQRVGVNCNGGPYSFTTLEIGNPAFSVFAIEAGPWQQAVTGQPFTLSESVSGGVAPYFWTVTSGALPTGLTLNTSTGLISGTPTGTGSYPFTVQVQDSTGGTAVASYPISVYPSIGGLAYSRTPAGNTVPSSVTAHVKGIFGADFCNAQSTNFNVVVLGSFNIQSNNYFPTVGTVVDQDFTFELPLGTYQKVGVNCNGGSYSFTTLENGNFVAASNQAPVLASIGNKTVNEGQNLSFTLNATDPDGDALIYSASNLPGGATFNPATRIFTWTPNYGQAGNYPDIEFTVTDNGTPSMLDFEDLTITVGHVNRAPIFAPVGARQVLEHNMLTFTVSATDPDNNAITLSAQGMPAGATFATSTGVFSWTPGTQTSGVYTPTFIARDNGNPFATSTIDVVITVGSNPTPIEQSQILINTVIAENLPTNTINSYLANLNKVGPFIQQGKTTPAINQLNAFIQKVNQDYQLGSITLTQKNQLITLAQTLISALN